MARRSLLDAVDLAAVREGARRRGGPFAAAVAALLDGGLLTHDPTDPGWSERDRLVVGGTRAAAALLDGEPGERVAPLEALRAAVAAARDAEGGVYRVWCLLDAAAGEHGTTWEAARDAAAAGMGELCAVCGGGSTAGLLALAGWRVQEAEAGDVLGVLAALDRAAANPGRPSAVALR